MVAALETTALFVFCWQFVIFCLFYQMILTCMYYSYEVAPRQDSEEDSSSGVSFI